jgi:hypothetical protein
VPVPDDLLKRLKKYKMDNPEKSFVIGNAKNRPEIHLLRLRKKLVKDAGLNRGHCRNARAGKSVNVGSCTTSVTDSR